MLTLAAVGLAVLRWRPSRWAAEGIALAGALGALLPVVVPFSGPARTLLTATHVLGALIWVGGLVVLAAAGLLSRRGTADARDWAQTWERFSVLALWCVGAMIVSGAWLAWTHVGSPAQLLTTPYGRHLTLKLVLVGALLAAGVYNTRVLLPCLRAAQAGGDARTALRLAVHHFPAVVAAESAVAVAILAVVPFLRGSARSQAGGPAAGPFDLTVFGCGAVLVALTAAALWAGTRVPPRTPVPARTSVAPRLPAPGQASAPPGPGRTG
jgi:putative copper resistance protein D